MPALAYSPRPGPQTLIEGPRQRRQVPRHIMTGDMTEGPEYRVVRTRGSGDYLLFFTTGGGGRFFSATGEPARARPGQMHLYAPGHHQDYGTDPAAGHWRFLFSHFDPPADWLPLLAWPRATPDLHALETMTGKLLSAVRESLREMHHLRQSGQPRADWLARNALERALLRADAANPAHERRQLDERVLQAMDYVGRHFDQPVQVAMIARAVGLSASRLSHLFGEQTGQSPVAYLEATRLRHARELLEYSARPVSAIAEACGFSSAFYFSTRFRRHFGLSPSAFRQSLRSGRAD